MAAVPVAAAVVAPQFALAPGVHGAAAFIDYGTSEGLKLYKAMKTPIDNLFDCSPRKLKVFLSALGDRAGEYGWDNVLDVPEDVNNPAVNRRNLLTEYGRISLDQVTDHANTYVAQQTRQAQNSYAMYLCVVNSLTPEAKAKIMLKEDEYTVNGIRSGACLLKVVIRASYLDSNATSRFVREAISNLDEYIVSVDSNIEKFNEHVEDLLDSLYARGEETHDLVSNLFKAYKECGDAAFVGYMTRKEELYDEGNDYTPDALMQLAKDKYDALVEAEKWMAKSEEQKKIVALEATVDQLKRNIARGKGDTNKSEQNKKQDKKSHNKGYEKPEWMTKEPSGSDPKTKDVDGKTYYWCPTHGAWGRHKPADCKGKGYRPGKEANNNEQENGDKANRIARALATVAEAEEQEI